MKFVWHPAALDEYEDASFFYGLRESGLDERFQTIIESAIEGICESPKAWPFSHEDARRRVVDVFPYSIIYLEVDGRVVIIAVMHDSREPGYWLDRIE